MCPRATSDVFGKRHYRWIYRNLIGREPRLQRSNSDRKRQRKRIMADRETDNRYYLYCFCFFPPSESMPVSVSAGRPTGRQADLTESPGVRDKLNRLITAAAADTGRRLHRSKLGT